MKSNMHQPENLNQQKQQEVQQVKKELVSKEVKENLELIRDVVVAGFIAFGCYNYVEMTAKQHPQLNAALHSAQAVMKDVDKGFRSMPEGI